MASPAEPPAPLKVQVDPAGQGSLAALLQFEADLRRQASLDELTYLAANELRRIVPYEQLFVLREAMASNAMHVVAASSVALVDRNAPLIQAIDRAVSAHGTAGGLAGAASLVATDVSDDPAVAEYPFHGWYWQPLKDRAGKVFGGLLLTRAAPLDDREAVRLERVGETMAHAWLALTAGRPVRKVPLPNARQRKWLAIGAAVVALFPVRMSALAPVEVVAARPFVVSAPFAGVIRQIMVPPNAMVRQGQPVLVFEDVKVRNELQQAQERLAVARAKLDRAMTASFADAREAHEIAQLRAEADLARTDYAYAQDVMAKSQVLAPRDGMAIYSDRRDWEGRALNIGDPILQIADPKAVAFHIDLPAKEQLRLTRGAPVKVWLDSQPLWALGGRVQTASYQARPTADGILAFAVTARPEGEAPRIGSRGTAKLYGQWAPLGYALLRRPISAVRQALGI